MVSRISKAIAMMGLKEKQKKLLAELAECHVSGLRAISQSFRDDEDIARAGMVSQPLGLEIVTKKLEEEKERKNKIKGLTQKCREMGIEEWRIKLVT